MGFLLDINVLIARSDHSHEFFERTRAWMKSVEPGPFVLCPITENGFVRIYGHPDYPGGPGSPAAASKDLRRIRNLPTVRFLPDNLSITDRSVFNVDTMESPRAVTDLYLLGTAAAAGLSFATLDTRIDPSLVVGGKEALLTIPG